MTTETFFIIYLIGGFIAPICSLYLAYKTTDEINLEDIIMAFLSILFSWLPVLMVVCLFARDVVVYKLKNNKQYDNKS